MVCPDVCCNADDLVIMCRDNVSVHAVCMAD